MSDLKEHYKKADNLNTRISIHDYSTNKQGFGNWIISHYEIQSGTRILELGCGTGYMWMNHLHLLHEHGVLHLTDFSEGMLETARTTLGEHPSILYSVVDIQDIPFPNASFDIVIANMMLYHVPNLPLGLSEVRRVLKPGGKFYCATYGEHGITEYIADLLKDFGIEDRINRSFTLQNGAAQLNPFFHKIMRDNYPDSLAIPNIDQFIDYIYSLAALDNLQTIPRDVLQSTLKTRIKNGILTVPKEYGMFICE